MSDPKQPPRLGRRGPTSPERPSLKRDGSPREAPAAQGSAPDAPRTRPDATNPFEDAEPTDPEFNRRDDEVETQDLLAVFDDTTDVQGS